jgi:Rod binding domain-containing protein
MIEPVATDGFVRPPAGSQGTGPGRGAATPVDPAIVEAARGFEGIFMSMLIGEMLAGTAVASANPMHVGLVTEKLGDSLAAAGGIGLAAVLERQLGGAG